MNIMNIDPHFYEYTEDGFRCAPTVIDWDLGEPGDESFKIMLANGWIKDDELGDTESACSFTIYRPVPKDGESIGADGRRLVEMWDSCACVWTVLVDPAYWPKFYREEVYPMLSHAKVWQIAEQLTRLSNAVIGSARYAHAISSDIDRYSGEATKDLQKDRDQIKRYQQNAN